MLLKLVVYSFFYLFGTVLHECAHYLAALVFGRPAGFSVLPRIEGGKVIFGNTAARTSYSILAVAIAAAPLVWWVVLVLLLQYLNVVHIGNDAARVNSALLLKTIKTFSLSDGVFLWLCLQLLWAGRLSFQDLKTIMGGLFSPSGILVIFAGLFVFWALIYLQ